MEDDQRRRRQRVAVEPRQDLADVVVGEGHARMVGAAHRSHVGVGERRVRVEGVLLGGGRARLPLEVGRVGREERGVGG